MSSEDQQALRLRLVYFMRRLLLAPLILVLSSCSYGSSYEARKACGEWREKGGTWEEEYIPWGYNSTQTIDHAVRTCRSEEETNQILGFEDKNRKKDASYKVGEDIPDPKLKVIKRFKY